MSRPVLLALALALMALLTFFCLRTHAPAIESGIAQRADAALSSKGIDWAEASVSGRDVLLEGIAPDPSSRTAAELALREIQGVRSIDNQITVLPQDKVKLSIPPQAGTPDGVKPVLTPELKLELNYDGTHLALSGSVPGAEQQARTVQSAKALVGQENLVDELQVNVDVPDSWTSLLNDTLLPNVTNYESAFIRLQGNHLNVEGYVSSGKKKQQLEAALREQLPGAYSLSFNVVSPQADLPLQQQQDPLEAEQTENTDDQSLTTPDVCQDSLTQLMQGKHIYFATSSIEIEEKSRPLLEQIASALKRCPDVPFEIAGHTDTRGAAAMNLKLSQGRADSVRQALIEQSIAPHRLTAKGYGETQPLTHEGSKQDLAKNRRIEFHRLDQRTKQQDPHQQAPSLQE